MPDVPYCSYSMNGKKESFADWVSDISPQITPFTSMLKKQPVKNTMFQWQTDSLPEINLDNAYVEGEDAEGIALSPTAVVPNFTQIFRKVVHVTDSANAVESYGRVEEVRYQIEKSMKEMKRDVERTLLLSSQAPQQADDGVAGQTGSLGHFIDASMKNLTINAGEFEDTLFEMTENLYTKGSEAYMIMYHPNLAIYFANLQERVGERVRIFENDTRFIKYVDQIKDPLGQQYLCIPNRFLEENVFYILDPRLVDLAVLRPPTSTALGKTGSSTKFMIEQEIGLRSHNPLAIAMGIVLTGPLPFTQPEDLTIVEGGEALFSTGWSERTANFQWYVANDSKGSGETTVKRGTPTSKDLSFTSSGSDFNKYYRCKGMTSEGESSFTRYAKLNKGAIVKTPKSLVDKGQTSFNMNDLSGSSYKVAEGSDFKLSYLLTNPVIRLDETATINIIKDGVQISSTANIIFGVPGEIVITDSFGSANAGMYVVRIETDSYYEELSPIEFLLDEVRGYDEVTNLVTEFYFYDRLIDKENIMIVAEKGKTNLSELCAVVAAAAGVDAEVQLYKGSSIVASTILTVVGAVENFGPVGAIGDDFAGAYRYLVLTNNGIQHSAEFFVTVEEAELIPEESTLHEAGSYVANDILITNDDSTEVTVVSGNSVVVKVNLGTVTASRVTLLSGDDVLQEVSGVSGEVAFTHNVIQTYDLQFLHVIILSEDGSKIEHLPTFSMTVTDPVVAEKGSLFVGGTYYFHNYNIGVESTVAIAEGVSKSQFLTIGVKPEGFGGNIKLIKLPDEVIVDKSLQVDSNGYCYLDLLNDTSPADSGTYLLRLERGSVYSEAPLVHMMVKGSTPEVRSGRLIDTDYSKFAGVNLDAHSFVSIIEGAPIDFRLKIKKFPDEAGQTANLTIFKDGEVFEVLRNLSFDTEIVNQPYISSIGTSASGTYTFKVETASYKEESKSIVIEVTPGSVTPVDTTLVPDSGFTFKGELITEGGSLIKLTEGETTSGLCSVTVSEAAIGGQVELLDIVKGRVIASKQITAAGVVAFAFPSPLDASKHNSSYKYQVTSGSKSEESADFIIQVYEATFVPVIKDNTLYVNGSLAPTDGLTPLELVINRGDDVNCVIELDSATKTHSVVVSVLDAETYEVVASKNSTANKPKITFKIGNIYDKRGYLIKVASGDTDDFSPTFFVTVDPGPDLPRGSLILDAKVGGTSFKSQAAIVDTSSGTTSTRLVAVKATNIAGPCIFKLISTNTGLVVQEVGSLDTETEGYAYLGFSSLDSRDSGAYFVRVENNTHYDQTQEFTLNVLNT